MPTYYLDAEGGNDANDGLSFANRWKTFSSGATAARTAPGDTIRVMASPDPTSLGISATWTNASNAVTLASALNVLIDNCDTAWTASPNVTCTADATTYRTSTKSSSIAIAAGFTTGLAAYFALGGAQDYSSYQGITFWVQSNVSVAGSTLSIRLCSDAAGAVSVDTLTLPALPGSSLWMPVYIDKGSALGNSIQSIALYCDADPGAVTVLLDNISTVKAAGSDNLNLTSLIGKNTAGEYWWAIRSINGTAVVLDESPVSASGTSPRGYVGTTGSVTTYKRDTIKTTPGSGTFHSVQEGGSAGSPITYSFGWDRTAMTTQSGYSYFDGQNCQGTGLASSFNYITIDRYYAVRYSVGMSISGTDNTLGTCGVTATGSSGVTVSSGATRFRFTELSAIQGSNTAMTLPSSGVVGTTCIAYGYANGITLTGRAISITTLRAKNITGNALSIGSTATNNVLLGTVECSNSGGGFVTSANFMDLRIKNLTAASNSGTGVVAPAGINNRIDIATITSNNVGLLLQGSTFFNAELVIGNLTTSGNTTCISTGTLLGTLYIGSATFGEATPITFSSTDYTSGRIVIQNYDGVAGDHRTYYSSGTGGATVVSESTTRHSSNGLAWKFNIQSTTFVTSDFPIVFPVARIAVAANIAVTANIWTRRSATSITGTFRCRGGQLTGIANDVTVSSSAAIDTWEILTLTFTPTEVGVLDLDFLVSGATGADLFIHDLTISQV